MGKVPQTSAKVMSTINLFSLDKSAQELQRLETLGIEDPATVQTQDQKGVAAKGYLSDTIQILEDSRHDVRLPWREDHRPLQRNVHLVAAKSRDAPVEIAPIPRLKLLTATVVVRLCRSVQTVLEGINWTYYCSDSSTLTWENRNEPRTVFFGYTIGQLMNQMKRASSPQKKSLSINDKTSSF